MRESRKQTLLNIAGALFAPFFLYTPWLVATACGNSFQPAWGESLSLLALAMSVGAGLVFLTRLRIPILTKACFVPVYAAAMGGTLFMYTFLVAGMVFGLWP